MKIDSYIKSLIIGAVTGALQIVILTIFMGVILHLTGGESFFHKEEINTQIGNIRLDNIDKIGYILAAIVPIMMLRYSSIKYFPSCMFSGIASYFASFCVLDAVLYYVFSCNVLGGLDVLHFGGWIFPVGALFGTAVSVIVNTTINSNRKRKNI